MNRAHGIARVVIAGVAAIFANAPQVRASSMLYTTASSFAAATTGDTSITFTAPGPTGYTNVGSLYTDAGTGTQFSIAAGTMVVSGMNDYESCCGGAYSSDFLVGAYGGSLSANTVTIELPTGDSAFGFDIGGIGLLGANVFNVTLSNGSVFAISAPAPFNTAFFGFTAPGGISSLSFGTPANESFVITDAVVGGVAPVPEPATLTLTALGLAGIVTRYRGRRSHSRL